jgi:hypothetical protein
MTRTILAVAATLLLAGAAHAAEQPSSLKERYLENLAGAIAIQAHCSAWTIDPKAASEILNFFRITMSDITPDGKDWKLIEKYMIQSSDMTREFDEPTACVVAELGYGPNGLVSPKMMIKKPH